MKLIRRRPMVNPAFNAPMPAAGPWEFLQGFPLPWHLAVLTTIMAVIGFALPWVTIDDHEQPLNAAGIMTYYATAHDRWPVLKTSPLGSLISFLAPAIIVTATVAVIPVVATARKISLPAVSLTLSSLLAAAALLACCGEILDPDLPRFGPFTVPGAGLSIVIAANLTATLAGCCPTHQAPAMVTTETGPDQDKDPAHTEQCDKPPE